MVHLNNFDANKVEPAADFDPIPAGQYVAVITDSQMKPTKNGTGEYLELTFQVIEGDYKNRLLWARLCLNHSKEITAKIARGHLAAICRAVGVLTPRDSAELHNLPLVVKVTLKKRTDTGELTNEIKAFSARENRTAAVAGTTRTTAPWRR
ncbi:MAG: DUF669 domain-containing protein [Phycisphaerae bacterium]|nr:DUF669 domain-containing protein [Phycisphaerae bacterium]